MWPWTWKFPKASFFVRSSSLACCNMFHTPEPQNEPMRTYAPGSPERALLMAACAKMREELADVPIVIGGKEIRTGAVKEQVMPSEHAHVLCRYRVAEAADVTAAIDDALRARAGWAATPFAHRAGVLLRTAELLATKYRYEILAATMLGQGKTVWQAEIDASAETIDFLRFNVRYAEDIYKEQPPRNAAGTWNRVEYRALEGYVVAISPFNFTAVRPSLSVCVAHSTDRCQPSHCADAHGVRTVAICVSV